MSPHRSSTRPLMALAILLVAGGLIGVGLHYWKDFSSRPGHRRVVLKSVLMTRDRIINDDGQGTLSGWFRITAVIENRDQSEVIVDCSTRKTALGSKTSEGTWTTDWEPKDPAWSQVYSLRPGASVTLTERFSGHFSDGDAFLQLTLKTDGVEQVLEGHMDKDW